MIELTGARLHICEGTTEDLPALLPVYTSNPAFVRQNEGSEGEPGRYDLDRWQRDWHIARLLPGNHWLGCYLYEQRTPVGILQFLEENSADGMPWLGTLVIHRLYQQQGLGTESFQCFTEYCRQHMHWTILRTSVKIENAAGLAFLKRMGFQPTSEGNGRFANGVRRFLLMDLALAEQRS